MKPRSMPHIHSRSVARLLSRCLSTIAAMAALNAISLPTTAYSAETFSTSTQKTDTQQSKKKGSLKIKHQRSPSEETTAERDRRLKRECKGAPNAGACLGYARK